MGDKESQEVVMAIDAQPETRKGVYSNFVSLQSSETECLINFCLIDGNNPDGHMTGVLVSRVIMRNEQLIDLRDAIDRQIIANASVHGTKNE
ncbi:DUF3467 domain-containing protein [Senegalimassilia sp.]